MNTNLCQETDLPYPKHRGKVRDSYDLGDSLLMVTTDRLSAFDRDVALIPGKGQVLTELSAWWFEKTRHIIANHLQEQVDERTLKVKKCQALPIEVVVRGYLTGNTNTSIWPRYQQGQRQFFTTTLPDGLTKNTALRQPILTPSTKDADHDQPIDCLQDLLAIPGIDEQIWSTIADKSLQLFTYGQKIAQQAGLILVDTKYEFGLDHNANIMLIDECHTPDSSRFWQARTYQQRLNQGQQPDNFDKDIIRRWLAEHCDPYNGELPEIPDELIAEVTSKYQQIRDYLVKPNHG